MDARIGLLLSLAVLVTLYTATAGIGDGSYAVRGDAHYLYLTGRSLAFDGDLDLTNQLRALGDRWGLGRDPAQDGWRFPPREIGPALLMVPGLVAHWLLGLPERWAPTFAVTLAAASLGLLFVLCHRIAKALGVADRPALLVAGFASLGFVVPYYAIGRVGYAHAPDALVCAAIALALLRRGPAWQTGLLVGVGVLFRLQNFLWLAWPLVELARTHSGHDRPARARGAVTIGSLSLLGLLPQLWLNFAHPGSEQGAIRWDSSFFDLDGYAADLLTVVVGGHGLLSWTPIAALAIAGLWMGRREHPACIPAAAVLFLNVLLVASVRDPSGGWAFGARRLAGCTAALSIGLAAGTQVLRRRAGAPVTWWAVGGILVAANLTITALALAGSISLAP
jgi:hypothetical protein